MVGEWVVGWAVYLVDLKELQMVEMTAVQMDKWGKTSAGVMAEQKVVLMDS